MNPDTGELKRRSELLEEFGSDEAITEAGFKRVPKHLEVSAERLLKWAERKKEQDAKEKAAKAQRKRYRKMTKRSKRRNR